MLVEATSEVISFLIAYVRTRPVGDAWKLLRATTALVTEHVERPHLVLWCPEVLKNIVEVALSISRGV